jgi:DNA polymerase-3 subunit epsilon
LNPQRSIDEEAEKVHGLSIERLSSEPEFSEIAESFLEFVEGSILVIHNAAFDLGFLNAELKRASSKHPSLEEICDVEDTLLMARTKFPGQRNSLDALANRFEVSGYDRSFHGALLDANILADVYIHLTGGQSKFEFITSNTGSNLEGAAEDLFIDLKKFPIPKIIVSKEDMLANEERINAINAKEIPHD